MRRTRTITTILVLLSCITLSCEVTQTLSRRQRLARIDRVVKEEIQDGNIPGAVVLVGRADRILYWEAFGSQMTEPQREAMTKDAIFDLASLTKPIATATSIMILRERGELDLDDFVAEYLPAFGCQGKEGVRIKHLLAHTSGLPAYTSAGELEQEFGTPCPDKLIEKVCSLEPLSPPGEKFRYSCLGYITLAKIVEVVAGEAIDDFAGDNIFAPLRMKHTMYNPPESWQENIAATEIVDGQVLRGTVHDPLARLAAGVSGNAGLFSTAYDLSIYCRMLLSGGVCKNTRVLSSEAVELLTTAQSHGRAYGFDVSSGYSWVKGSLAPKEAFCHTGFTGTSIVCDPASRTYVIILTNVVHPYGKGTSRPIRTKVADVVFSSL
ncbi:MAG: beta-lactamase family protein [Phycisphaerales bacterium]|nr:MAG: beta-lactamase family protein [Phycisphaerales bacterium]